MRHSDVVQESGLASGLIMSAQGGLSAGSYVARAEAAQTVIAACEAGKQHVEQTAGEELNTQTASNHSLGASTMLNVGVGLGISIAAPVLAPVVAKIGMAQFGVDLTKSMGKKSEFSSFLDQDEDSGFDMESSKPTATEISKQTAGTAPMPAEQFNSCFAENLDAGIKERGAATVYKECDSGVTRTLAEGQLSFSLEQLSNSSSQLDDDVKTSIPTNNLTLG